MADTTMPLWRRTEAIEAMRIDAIEVPNIREPFMWNLVGYLSRCRTHVEQVHAHWIAQHKPEVGGYLVRELDGSMGYLAAGLFEQWHVRMTPEPAHDIEPLAGQVWTGPDIPRFLAKPVYPDNQTMLCRMEGVDIDAAHGQGKK